MTNHPYFRFRAWDTDAKITLIATVTTVADGVSMTGELMKPEQLQITLELGDKNAGNISKGQWVELDIGRNTYVTIFRGYIQQITKTVGSPGTLVVEALDALYILGKKRNLGALKMHPANGYLGIQDVFNGAGSIANGGVSMVPAKGQLGILNEFGTWVAQWLDGANGTTGHRLGTVGGITSSGAITAGTRAITFSGEPVAKGLKVLIDPDQVGEEYVTVASSPAPTYDESAQTGTFTATFAHNHGAPCIYAYYVDVYRGDWDSVIGNIQRVCEENNIYARLEPGVTNTASAATLQIGPLLDAGYTAWGGLPLHNDLKSHGYLPSDSSYEDVAVAQANGYAVIDSAEKSETWTSIINVVWGHGHGKPEGDAGATNLHDIESTSPLHTDGTLNTGDGWALLSVPPADANGRKYYYKPATKVTYAGSTYVIVASMEQDTTDDNAYSWSLGVMNLTGATKYGIHETWYENSQQKDAEALLTTMLGMLDFNSDPVPTTTFTIRQPLTASSNNGVPSFAYPGMLMDINYEGYTLHTVTQDVNGEWVDNGAYVWMKFPKIGDPVDENGTSWSNAAIQKMSRVVSVQREFAGDTYYETVQLGQGKWHSSYALRAIAKKMEKRAKHHPHAHTFKKNTIDNIKILTSNAPLCWESHNQRTLNFNPGSTAVTNNLHPSFFNDRTGVSFTILLTGNDPGDGETFDFWINKPINKNKVTSPYTGPGNDYLVLRLALTNSPNATGFFTTHDGITYTARGHVPKTPALDTNRRLLPGVYYVHVTFSGGRFEAHIENTDTDATDVTFGQHLIATFDDVAPSGSQIVQTWGAIGWKLHGGSQTAILSDLHMIDHKPSSKGRSGLHNHLPFQHDWHNTVFRVASYNVRTLTASIFVDNNGGSAALKDWNNNTILAEGPTIAGTAINDSTWNATFNAKITQHIVYNGTGRSITDGSNVVSPYTFGALDVWKPYKPAWSNVFHVGRMSTLTDKNTHKPWINMDKPGSHEKTSTHQAPGSISYAELHRAHHSTGHFTGGNWRTTSAYFWGAIPNENSGGNGTFYFATHDASGDIVTPGRYRIAGPLPKPALDIETSKTFIGPNGNTSFTSTFPNATPANNLVTFTNWFPGGATPNSVSTGALSAATYHIRYCYIYTFNSVVVESALSEDYVVTVGASSSITFGVDELPGGFTGIHLYVGTSLDGESLQTGNFIYDSVNNLVEFGAAVNFSAGKAPSYGFYAWDAKDITDKTAHYLMKIGHFSDTANGSNSNYTFHGVHGISELQSSHHAPRTLSGGQWINPADHSKGQGPEHYIEGSVNHVHINSYVGAEAAGKLDLSGGFSPSGYALISDGAGSSSWSSVSASAGVSSINTKTGAVTLQGSGNGITVSNPSGSIFDFALPAGGSIGDALRWSGSAWVSGVLSFMANPMTSGGQIIYGGTAGAPTALPAGGTGTYLKSNGSSAPTWGVLPTIQHVTREVITGNGGMGPYTVSFPNSYSLAPTVVFNEDVSAPGGYFMSLTNITTTGFDIYISANLAIGSTLHIDWISAGT